MSDLVGTAIAGYKVTEALYEGAWSVCRGLARDGGRVLVTVTAPPTPAATIAALALPFEGIPRLRATEPTKVHGNLALAVIEDEPPGVAISDLKWPMPIDEVITVGLDLARLLQRMHAAGAIHGSLRPQTTWIHTTSGGRCSLAGTTPRPELAGVHSLAPRSSGSVTPFIEDVFFDDTLACGKPRSIASDVAQLGMLLHRMTMHASPFAGGPDASVMDQLALAMRGEAPPWPAGDERARAVEALARRAFDPAHGAERSIEPLVATLAELAR